MCTLPDIAASRADPAPEDTERELIDACRGKRPDLASDAFRQLFERYKDKVYSIALRYSGDASAAQDIAQDVFVKLLPAIGGFRGECRFDSWLYRLVVNCCFDQKRRTRRFLPLMGEFLGILHAPETSALDRMVRSELGESLKNAVARLPDEQRMVVVLRYTEGLSYEEIAEIMGCSTGTVASRLNRVHRTLGRRLARYADPNRSRGARHD